MKLKITSLLSLCMLLAWACQNPDMDSTGDGNDPSVAPETGTGTVTFTASSFDTKVSVGEKNDQNIYPGLWEAGDAVKVVYISDASEAGTATVSDEDAGRSAWSFALNGVDLGVNVRAVYPASAGYGATVELPAEQVQTAGSSSIGKYSYALSEVVQTSATAPVTFSLNYVNALLKINLKTTEYAEYSLKSVGFFSKGSVLAGQFTVSDAGEVTPGENTSDKVVVTLAEPALLDETKTVWMTALPADLTDKAAYVVATIEKDGEELVVPVEFAGKPVQAGKVNVIDVELSAAKTVQWYVGSDPREMLGYYAYGPANTVMVEKSYVGSSGTNTYDRSFNIEVKARGDFYQVSEPKYYGLLTKSENGNRLLAIGSSNTNTYSVQPITAVSDDYTVGLNMSSGKYYSSTGSWGTVAIYDEAYNLLWSFMVCSYFDNDPLKDIDCGTYGKVMDRALGQAFSGSYMDSHIADLTNSNFAAAAYFQWGRKDPFMFAPISNYTNPYVVCTEKLSIAESISKPYAIVVQDGDVNWCTTDEADLWGNVSQKKTAFDPCPQGYKVPGPALLRQIDSEASSTAETGRNIDESGDYYYSVSNPVASESDKWIYSGLLWAKSVSSSNWANSATRKEMTSESGTKLTQHPCYAYWANSQASDAKGNWISFGWNGKWTSRLASKNSGKGRGAAVRCMKE